MDRRAPRLGRLRRGGGRCRADRRDAAAALPAGGGPLVDGEDRAHRPPDQQADRADHPARGRHADPGERGLRRRRGALPQAGAHARPADRPEIDVGAGGADPGAGRIKEAQRSFTYFHLYGYPTDLVVANRILPDDVGWKYFRGWYEAQQRYGPMVEQAFAPIPVRYAPFFDREVVGVRDAARAGAGALRRDRSDAAVLSRPPVHRLARGRRVPAQRGAAVRVARRRSRSRATPTRSSSTWAAGGATWFCRAR